MFQRFVRSGFLVRNLSLTTGCFNAATKKSIIDDALLKRLRDIKSNHPRLVETLAESGVSKANDMNLLRKQVSNSTAMIKILDELDGKNEELKQLAELKKEASSDKDMLGIIESDIEKCHDDMKQLEEDLTDLISPSENVDERNAVLEIRPGTGGLEASLFAQDLLKMYKGYSDFKRWSFEPIEITNTEVGGFREAVVSISGKDVFGRLKYESGVHRVQRVPVTEGSGRVHTSTATVAILAEAEEVDVRLQEKDLRIEVFRSSGAGGQSVNKTESAVRITHIPTGITVSMQDERSQHKNKAKAMKLLRSRIYEQERIRLMEERSRARKEQVGKGDRSERIRTYNFPQGRITDHRIGFTTHDIENTMTGIALDEIVEALRKDTQEQAISAFKQTGYINFDSS